MKRILVTGAAGQLGGALCRLAWPEGYETLGIDRDELDLGDAAATARFVAEGGFAAVVNAAAYTAVDRAETEIADAWRINAQAPAVLAEATARLGIPIVQISTDYVFDGAGDRPFLPDAPIRPLNVYGASKAAGELAVRTGNPRHAVVRTSWVISAGGSNFLLTMLRLAEKHSQLRVIDDQWGAPTSAADLAAALVEITTRFVEDDQQPSGTWHFTNAGETTWCRIAREIFRLARPDAATRPVVEAITTADYPTPARRPANSRLSLAALEASFGIRPRPWEEAIADIVQTVLADRRT